MQGIDRCGYNCLVYLSSPGYKEGPFYEAFNPASNFITFHAGLSDCAWIPAEKIRDIIQTHGEDSPYTQSVVYGNFMDFGSGVTHLLEWSDIETWLGSVVEFKDGPTVYGLDFAMGRDDNALTKLRGNKIMKIVPWKEQNTAKAVREFIGYLYQLVARPF